VTYKKSYYFLRAIIEYLVVNFISYFSLEFNYIIFVRILAPSNKEAVLNISLKNTNLI
jgi:hypothetical protein